METGIATYEYRHFPVFGDQSWFNALAADCAGDQGVFWPWHDELMKGGEEAYTREGAIALAEQFEIDGAVFAQCLDEEVHLPRIEQLARAASRAGVQRTPTLVVDGVQVEPTAEAVIEAATAGTPQ